MIAIPVIPSIALGLVLASGRGLAQNGPQNPPPNYGRDGPGPWNNDVVAYRAAPGRQPEQLTNFGPAGVPTVARLKDGRLLAAFQWFPKDSDRFFDRVAVRFSSDEGKTWTGPEAITVHNMDPGLMRPFDPTLVPLPDGSVRLYFTSNPQSTRGPGEPAIHSAVSKDGIRYEYEPGARFAIPGRMVIDCAAALIGGVYHLVVPDNGNSMPPPGGHNPPGESGVAYHAVSKDGLRFERTADLALPDRRGRWLGNLTTDGDRFVFFGTGPGRWPVTSANGSGWTGSATPVAIPGADPAAVKLRDGSWLLLVTSRRGNEGSVSPPPPDTTAPPTGPADRPADNTSRDRASRPIWFAAPPVRTACHGHAIPAFASAPPPYPARSMTATAAFWSTT